VQPAVPRVDFGKVISKGFQIYLRNLPAFLLLSTIVFTPLILWAILARNPDPVSTLDDWNRVFVDHAMVLLLGIMLAQFIVVGAITYGVVEEHAGRHPSISESLALGVKRLPMTIAVGLLVMLATFLGVFALIVGAFFVACMLYVAVPASVVERPGVVASLVRSVWLTKGYRWWILLLFVIAGAAGLIVGTALEQALCHHVTIEEQDVIDVGDLNRWMLIQIAVQVIVAPLQAVFASTTYLALRSCKEATPIDKMWRHD
jgi:hypothetical protein